MKYLIIPFKRILLIKVVVRAEILPKDFLQTLEIITCHLLQPNSKFKILNFEKISSIVKDFDREIISFQNKRTSPHPEILIKVYR